MLKFIYFLYLNRKDLSYSFVVLSFYRNFKRIQRRLKTFDSQDKLFLFFASSNILIAFLAFYFLENPGLKIVDTYIVHTILFIYSYLLAKKIANLNYFPSVLLFFISCPTIMFIVFGIVDFFNNEPSIFLWLNDGELSFLMQSTLKALNLLSSFLENSNIAGCQPSDPVKLPSLELPSLNLPKPVPPATYRSSGKEALEHGAIGVALSVAFKANPRTRLLLGVGVGSFSFLSNFIK
jgi:hypothetical protein